MLLSIVFIGQKLFSYRESLDVNLSGREVLLMVVCAIVYGAIVYTGPFIFKWLLYITTEHKLSYVKVANVYCKSNIMKYLPGNVMQYVGRNEIAVEEDLSHTKVALATILEIVVVVLSTVVISIFFSWKYAVEWINKFVDIDVKVVLLIAIVLVVVCLIILFIFKEKIIGYFKSILTIRSVMYLMGLILYHGVIMIVNSILYFYVLSLIGIELEAEHYLVGIGLYSLSFVLGYVTPGVPGGIGVREAVLVYFFSAFIEESQILSGALIFRIISIIGDFIALGIAMLVTKVTMSKNNDNQEVG